MTELTVCVTALAASTGALATSLIALSKSMAAERISRAELFQEKLYSLSRKKEKK